ncbi:hypothetical protein Plhal304r1_c066g0153911 [Plasmopara halstedii]
MNREKQNHQIVLTDRSAYCVELLCLFLLICSSTSSPSFILAVRKRRRRKSLFARLFSSECPSGRDNASCAPLSE